MIRLLRLGVAGLLVAGLAVPVLQLGPARAATLQPGFTESTVINGLTQPTSVRFAPDGRIFVGEKSGLIKVFDSLSDATPTTVADLRTNVYNFWDRGLLGLALDPSFTTTRPYLYVLYTYDAPIGGTAPYWGTAGATSDRCPTPPGPTADGCVVSGRLSRITVGAGSVMTGAEQVLINDWCQQFPSHSIGDLQFGRDGALYVSGGEGADFNRTDYGQFGNPQNPCGDPPVPVGGAQSPPSAEGGALRSQDLRTGGDPVGLGGTVLRVSPDTGAALPDNPLASSSDANARRIVAYGLRNPFRMTTRAGTDQIWIGDVGSVDWEEIDLIADGDDATVENFGWPCYEGRGRQTAFDAADLGICEQLYGEQGAVTDPYYTYHHNEAVVPGETCPIGGSSTSGLTFRFYEGGSYPAEYEGALFFADYSRDCIWVMFKASNGNPDTTKRKTFVAGAANPVDLQTGPGGDLFYVDFDGGTVRRISYGAAAVSPPTESSYLSDLAWTSMTNGWGPVERDTSNGESASGDGRVITLNGTTYTKGLGAHAASDVRYNLGGNCSSFTADVGVDDEVGDNGSVVFQVWADGSKLYDSGAMTGPSATKSVNVSTSGTNELRLVVTDGGDGNAFDHADWAGARVTCGTAPAPTPSSYLSDLAWTSMTNGWGPVERDTSNGESASGDGRVITLNGTTYTKGLGAHAASDVRYNLGGNCSSFTADVGVDDEVGENGSVVFQVWADGSQLYDSGAMTGRSVTKSVNVSTSGTNELRLVVTDGGDGNAFDHADWAAARVTCDSANTEPTATITQPTSTLTWKANDEITFSGSAVDAEDGTLAPSALSWSVILHHCPSTCHTHPIQSFPGVASGSFVAPGHEYPAHLELQLTAKDSGGLSDTKSVRLDPQTVSLTFATNPSGLQLVVGNTGGTAPFSRTAIVGSQETVSAVTPQTLNGTQYGFSSWSDGGAQTHSITVPAVPATYTATYTAVGDTTPPVISGVSATANSPNAAAVTWKTDEPADSQVEYGTTTSYGSSSALDATLVTSHSVKLRGLSRNTVYHYRVRSRDAAGNLSVSGDFTFKTKG